MTGLTYSSGEPIRVGDTVRRSRTAQSLYEVTDIRATGRPSVGLATAVQGLPHQGRLAGGAVTRNTNDYHHNTTRT